MSKGGKGSTRKESNCTQDSTAGERSSFGHLLRADGGGNHNGTCYKSWKGPSGGSGGGEGCITETGRSKVAQAVAEAVPATNLLVDEYMEWDSDHGRS